jgi:predicted Zn-ribbon and HTH transcriptional regulator
MAWKCLECGAENGNDSVRCSCGSEINEEYSSEVSSSESNALQGIGILLSILGTIGIIIGMNMDASVPTILGDVNNIGLLNQRSNIIIISAIVLVAGVIFLATSYVSHSNVIEHTEEIGTKECPACAENIKIKAQICRYCGYRFNS